MPCLILTRGSDITILHILPTLHALLDFDSGFRYYYITHITHITCPARFWLGEPILPYYTYYAYYIPLQPNTCPFLPNVERYLVFWVWGLGQISDDAETGLTDRLTRNRIPGPKFSFCWWGSSIPFMSDSKAKGKQWDMKKNACSRKRMPVAQVHEYNTFLLGTLSSVRLTKWHLYQVCFQSG